MKPEIIAKVFLFLGLISEFLTLGILNGNINSNITKIGDLFV